MSQYGRGDNFSRDDRRGYPPRFFSNTHDHGQHSEGRPSARPNFQVSRTQSQSNQLVARDYNPRQRDYVQQQQMIPPQQQPSREMVSVPEFNREQLSHQKDLVLLATVPFNDADISDHPLCNLLKRGVKNEENMLKSIEKLANVLGTASDFVADCPDATSAAKKAEFFRSDLDGRREFLESLDGTLTDSIENFFKIPDPE